MCQGGYTYVTVSNLPARRQPHSVFGALCMPALSVCFRTPRISLGHPGSFKSAHDLKCIRTQTAPLLKLSLWKTGFPVQCHYPARWKWTLLLPFLHRNCPFQILSRCLGTVYENNIDFSLLLSISKFFLTSFTFWIYRLSNILYQWYTNTHTGNIRHSLGIELKYNCNGLQTGNSLFSFLHKQSLLKSIEGEM